MYIQGDNFIWGKMFGYVGQYGLRNIEFGEVVRCIDLLVYCVGNCIVDFYVQCIVIGVVGQDYQVVIGYQMFFYLVLIGIVGFGMVEEILVIGMFDVWVQFMLIVGDV